ncbi:MAG: hypothetical protein ABEH35_04900 [Haloarculaceae archaeon]
MGILDTLELMVVVVFAAPVALLGVQFVVGDRPILGVGLLVVAGLMLAIEKFVTTPSALPGHALQKVAGTVAKTDDEE